MKAIAPEIIEVLRYLLPGFLMAWIFHGLTSYPKASEFDRIVEAVIFNLPIQVCVILERVVALRLGGRYNLGAWSRTSADTVTAFALGVLFAYLGNSDRLHWFARKLHITRETSYSSEWFGTFAENERTWVVLHFKDERRLYGWPDEWPSSPATGHFRLSNPYWLIEQEAQSQEGQPKEDQSQEDQPQETGQSKERQSKLRHLEGVRGILVNVKDVKWVEFMDNPEVSNVKEGTQPTTAAHRGHQGDQRR